MGAGASAQNTDALKAASQGDLTAFCQGLSADQRSRLQGMLVGGGGSAVEPDSPAQELLFKKCDDGDEEGVRQAVVDGAVLDKFGGKGDKKMTAAIVAARAGQPGVLKLLKELGANLDLADQDGWTAVHHAVRCLRKKTVATLFELGANFNALTNFKRNPVDILEEEQADLDDEDPEAGANNKIMKEMAEFFKEKSLKRSAQGSLLLAARSNDVQGVQDAVAAGADVNLKTVDSQTPLHLAAEKGSNKCIKALVDLGSELEGLDKDNWTAVHFAAAAGESECLTELANLGANLSAITKFKRNALDLVSEDLIDNPAENKDDPRKRCVGFLREKGLKTTAHSDLFRGAKVGDVDRVREAHEKGADIDLTNASSFTAFMCAADMGHEEVLKVLKELGADMERCDRDGWTAVHFAAYNGQAKVLKLLADLGADTAKMTKYKRNALDLAEDRLTSPDLAADEEDDYKEIVRWLRANRLKPSPQGKLWKSAKVGAIDGCKEALDGGAEINFKDFEGISAAEWAAKNGKEDCLQWLIENGAIYEG